MAKQCAACGNEYDKLIEITHNGQTDFFDCVAGAGFESPLTNSVL
jgi:hypothetical protein